MQWSGAIVIMCIFMVNKVVLSKLYDCQNIHEFEDSIFSQNGEDGILIYLLNLIGMKSKSYVEFGVEDGIQCNTRILREKFGFKGLMMDGGYLNLDIGLMKEFITESNILELFKKYSIPLEFDVLSIDIDMFDLWVLIRLLRDGLFRPRIIVVETNPTLCMSNPKDRKNFNMCNSVPLTVNHPNLTSPDYMWDLTRYSGANPKAFATIAKQYGYEMVYCERCGVNCFLVLRNELPQSCLSIASLDNEGEAYVPPISYPCFGVSGSGAAYPGHLVDPQKRSVMVLSDPVVKKILSNELTVDDVLGNQYSCEVGGQGWGRNWCQYIDLHRFDTNREWFGSQNTAIACTNALNGYVGTYARSADLDWIRLSSVFLLQGDQMVNEFQAFVEDVFRCITHHASEEGCSLSSALLFNSGIAWLLRYVAEDSTHDLSQIVSAYNSLWQSSQMCPNCVHAPYHLHYSASNSNTLQHFLFDYIQLLGIPSEKHQVFSNQFMHLHLLEKQMGETAPHHSLLRVFDVSAYTATIPVEYRMEQDGVVNQYMQLVSFHMCDDIEEISLALCQSIAPSDHNTSSLYTELIGTCVADLVERIKVEANLSIFPGLTFPLLFTELESLRSMENSVIFQSKLVYNKHSDRNSTNELVLRSYGCINHMVLKMTKHIVAVCSSAD